MSLDRLGKIKLFLGITDDKKDDVINLYVELIEQKILNYCNRKDLPAELEGLLVEMVVEYYNRRFLQSNNITGVETKNRSVSSVKRGDTQISYSTTGESSTFEKYTNFTMEEFLSDYKSQLNKFRKIRSA